MARIRTIKPEFWRNEALASISAEACLLAVGLLNHCDDEGYFNPNPKLVQSDIFPLRELSATTTVLLRELSDIGYITLFQGSDSKLYGLIPNFVKHQVINKKNPSKIKGLCELPYNYGSDTVVLPTGKEGKGMGNGKELEHICPPNGEPEPKIPDCDHQKVKDLYHQHLPTLRKVEVWNAARQGYLRQRWREVATELAQTKQIDVNDVLAWWADFFKHIAQSKFLTGRVNSKDGRAFAADLEWILKPSNFAKIIEGKYHGA